MCSYRELERFSGRLGIGVELKLELGAARRAALVGERLVEQLAALHCLVSERERERQRLEGQREGLEEESGRSSGGERRAARRAGQRDALARRRALLAIALLTLTLTLTLPLVYWHCISRSTHSCE